MPPSRKQQVVDLLKSLETKNPVPFAYVNPNKYIQHNLQVGPGPEGVAALIQNLPPDASVNTVASPKNTWAWPWVGGSPAELAKNSSANWAFAVNPLS